jgi:hypothetical protein
MEDSKNPSDWKIETVATLQPKATANTSGNSYALPFGLDLGFVKGRLWVAGGTSNVGGKKSPTNPNDNGVIVNAAQYIFAYAASDNSGVYYRDTDWKELRGDDNSLLDVSAGDTQSGWYIPLDAATDSGAQRGNLAEYVSAKPVIVQGILFIPTFIEYKHQKNSATVTNPCTTRDIEGKARLYAIDLSTGAGAGIFNEKFKEYEGTEIAGLTVTEDGLLAGFTELANYVEPEGKLEGESYIEIQLPHDSPGVNLKSGDSAINYWTVN